MAMRDILIGANPDTGEGGVGIFKGTNFKDSPDYKSDVTPCFDENVNQGSDTVGGTIEIEKLVYDSMADYIALRDKLKEMETVPTMITTFEVIKFKDEAPYTIQKNYLNCLISGNDKEDNPGEHSVRSLSFTYEQMVEKDPVQG